MIDFTKKRTQCITLATIGIFYVVGIVGHAFDHTLSIMIILTPWILLIFGGLAFFAEVSGRRVAADAGQATVAKILLWAAAAYVVTLLAEIVGVATGLVFGAYVYGETLGLKLLDVPVVIGFNWMVIVLGSTVLTTALFRRKGVAVFVAALIAVVFDFVMEPVAIALDYWTWTDGVIPLQNYIAWFVIALIASAAYVFTGITRRTWIPTVYVGIQLIFFSVVRLVS